MTLEDAIEALQTFKNVKRRVECIGIKNGITIYDDLRIIQQRYQQRLQD